MSDYIDVSRPMGAISQQELAQLVGAYRALTRLGRATSHGPVWDDVLDRGQQALGVTLAWLALGRIRVEGRERPPGPDELFSAPAP